MIIGIGLTVHCTRIRHLLKYASPIGGGFPDYAGNELKRVQKRGLAILGVENNAFEKLSAGGRRPPSASQVEY